MEKGIEEGASRFVAFMPLAHWARGFDRYQMAYSKSWNPQRKLPGRFYMLAPGEGAGVEPGLAKARDLARRMGQSSEQVAWIEARLPTGAGAMERNRFSGTGVGWAWPGESVPLSAFGVCGADGALAPLRHEELTARSYAAAREAGELGWADCRPRSFSVLPVARACQASCAFCFSKASASEAAGQGRLDPELARAWAREAAARGTGRAVITGGGEPTLRPLAELAELCEALSAELGSTLLISNGARWGAMPGDELARALGTMRDAGLSRLALSRHGVGPDEEARAMGIRANAARVAQAARSAGLRTRSICVMQRGLVDDAASAERYARAMAAEGVSEVCFKELYVSSLSENPWAASKENEHCEREQAPLGAAIAACEAMGLARAAELPWGAPVYEGEVDGLAMSIACYVEPSVGWEQSRKVARSWNLFADGSCLASLEDPRSALAPPWDPEASR